MNVNISKRMLILTISISGFLIFYTPLKAANYKYINNRVQKNPSQKTIPLSKSTLSEVVYSQDEKISLLKQQLLKSKAEQKKLKKELNELKKSFERFKNYYFRRY